MLFALVPAIVLATVLWQVLPVAASHSARAWEDGVVHYYDASGMRPTVLTAAARWNASGAHVKLLEVQSARDADGTTTVLLAQELRGNPRPLSVWGAAHELGHVLGLEHRDGRSCSLMSPHAFDTRCAPSLAAEPPTLEQLACVPAPADVEAAAQLYGGSPARRDPRCR